MIHSSRSIKEHHLMVCDSHMPTTDVSGRFVVPVEDDKYCVTCVYYDLKMMIDNKSSTSVILERIMTRVEPSALAWDDMEDQRLTWSTLNQRLGRKIAFK